MFFFLCSAKLSSFSLHVSLHPNKRIDIFAQHVWWDVSRGVIIAVSIECQTSICNLCKDMEQGGQCCCKCTTFSCHSTTEPLRLPYYDEPMG